MYANKNLGAACLRVASAALCLVCLNQQAQAATVDSVGDQFTVNFNGEINGVQQPGLTSSATFYLQSIVDSGSGGQTWSFDVSLDNTSSAPITASRVSVLGFDLSQTPSGESSSGLFNQVASGNMPIAGNLDVCFKNAGGTANCAGGGGGGVLLGDTGQFSFSLDFATALPSLTLDGFAVRYQSIAGSASGTSGVGMATVPIPSAVWMMGSALLVGMAGVGRQRSASYA